MVILQLLIGKARQAFQGRIFTGGPQRLQPGALRSKTGGLGRDRVALDVATGLRVRSAERVWQGRVQALVADLAELAEHLEVAAGTGADTAWRKEQLILMAAKGNAVGLQLCGHLAI